MKVKITNEQLEILEILDKLRRQHGILDTTRTYSIEELSSRLVCNPDTLKYVLIDILKCQTV